MLQHKQFFQHLLKKKFLIGDTIDIVFTFANKGDKPFNVSTISASLRYPVDWKVHIQNFTKQAVGVVVYPSEQYSFLYTFRPDAMLEPRDFGFSGQVFYSDNENRNFSTHFYNSTIALAEREEGFDIQLLFTYVGILAVFVLIAFFVYNMLAKAAKKTGVTRSRRPETQQASNVIDNEWLEGTSADIKRTKKQQQPQSPKSSKQKST